MSLDIQFVMNTATFNVISPRILLCHVEYQYHDQRYMMLVTIFFLLFFGHIIKVKA